MTEINDGGSAFPPSVAVGASGDIYDSTMFEGSAGMPLRDYIATEAMAAIIASGTVVGLRELDIALCAYSQADAMLEARAKAAKDEDKGRPLPPHGSGP